MSLIRINRTGQSQVTPASDGRLTISVPIHQAARWAEARDLSGW